MLAAKSDAKPSAIATLTPISAGCMASAAVMYPMDVVRALRMASAGDAVYVSTPQLLRNFVKAHGVSGLASQGVAPEIARATVMRVVQFFSYPLIHKVLFSTEPAQGTPMTKLASGMLASLPSAMAITPLENAKVALQLDAKGEFNNSMSKAVMHLWRRGALAPYVGFQAIFTRSAVSFGPYIAALPYCQKATVPVAKNALGDNSTGQTIGNLLGGFMAGSLGAAINCPFDLVRTNLQKQAIELAKSPMTTGQIMSLTFSPVAYWSVASQIIATRGVGALYMGLAFKIMHIGGMGAANAMFIPYFKRLFGMSEEF